MNDFPMNTDVLIWLRAEDGSDTPLGWVVAKYAESDFFTGWIEKSISGNINCGIRQSLVVGWKPLPEPLNDDSLGLSQIPD